MAYTPPSGSAVGFQFTGEVYTPPSGDAVNFDWSPDEFYAALSASISLSGFFDVLRVVPPVLTFVKTQVPLVGGFAAIAIPSGGISGTIELTGSSVGVGHAVSTLSSQLSLSGSVGALAASFGVMQGGIPLGGDMRGKAPYYASVAGKFLISGAYQAQVSPTSIFYAPIAIRGSVLANGGYAARVVGGIRVAGQFSAKNGRVLSMFAAVPMHGNINTCRGNGGTFGAVLNPRSSFSVTHVSPFPAAMHSAIGVAGSFSTLHIKPSLDPDSVVYVATTPQRAEVLTDV